MTVGFFMWNFIAGIVDRLFFSRRHKSLRGSVVFIIANLLLVASIIFFLEIILIFLGIGNFYLPLTRGIADLLAKLVIR
jgi:hypothetical protein